MITYGHESYIEEAINGVLMQECNFDVELIIVDDCSPDKTQEKVEKIIQKHKNGHWIRYTRHNLNKGIALNFAWSLEKGLGKYTAICEGDDYWTDPHKLQKQLDFLEANEQYSFCCHATEEVNENGEVFKIASRDITDISLSYVLEKGWFIRTNSIVLRKGALSDGFPEFFYTAYSTDYILQIMLLKKGNAFYMSDVMGAYRRHPSGITNASKEIQVKRWVQKLALLDILKDFTNHMFVTEIESHKIDIKQMISFYLLRNFKLLFTLGLKFYITQFNIRLALKTVFKKLSLKYAF